MEMVEQLKEIILPRLGKLSPTPSGFAKRNCMMCVSRGYTTDTRSRFGVRFEHDGIALNCFNCGFSAGWSSGKALSRKMIDFLKAIGLTDYEIKKIQFDLFRNKSSEVFEQVKNRQIAWPEKKLPDDALTIQQWIDLNCQDRPFLKTLEYLEQRKLDNFYNELYWSPTNNFHRRVIIPFCNQEGKTVGNTARLNIDANSKAIPKYITDMPHGYIYGLNFQKPGRKFVVICEGVLDALMIRGISTLGAPSQEQIEAINNLGKDVIVCPDFDKNGYDLVEVAISNGWGVSFPTWSQKHKDVAKASVSYGRILTLASIIDSVEENPFTIKVKWKIKVKA